MLGERISHIPVSIKLQSYVCQAAFCHSKKHPQQLNGLKQQTFLSCLCSIAWLQFWWNEKGRINIWGMITWSIKVTLRGWCGPSRLAESVYLTISLAYRAPKDHLTRMLLPELSHWLVHPENKCRVFLLWFIPKEGPRIHGLFTPGAQSLSESYSMLQVLTFGAPEWSHAWGSGGVLVTTGPLPTDTGITWWYGGPLNITDSCIYPKTFGKWVWDFQPFLPTLKRKGILMKKS